LEESNVAKIFEARNGDHFFLLAAMAAAVAAVFMVTIWGPLQVRAFDDATASAQTEAVTRMQSAAGRAEWARVPFVTADGKATSIEASNGQVRVVTMMYTHCPGVCPLAVSTLQLMESRLTPEQRERFSVVALSLDPERDSLTRLQEFRSAAGRGSQAGNGSERWIVGRPSTDGVRQLAGALGVNYRVLSDGSVDHQSVFVLLGRNGDVLARTYSSRSVDTKFFDALQTALVAN
jgi:cytochrome oxidase Cu insertion factor (SCO1/SenC/PrrC family)